MQSDTKRMRGIKAGLGLAAAAAGFAALAQGARGTTIYWDGTGTSWATAADWSTASNATTPNPAAPPGSGDTAIFNITTVNTAQTVTLDGNVSVSDLQFSSTGNVTLLTGNGTNTLALGTSGLQVNSGAGNVVISTAVTDSLGATWTNSSSNAFTLTGSFTSGNNVVNLTGNGGYSFSGPVTSTLMSFTGNGTLTISGSTDNTGFSLGEPSGLGTIILAKASSSTVHAVGGNLSIVGTLELGGTGGDQIPDTASLTLNSALFDMEGRSETIDGLSGAGAIVQNSGNATTSTLTLGANNGGGNFGGQLAAGVDTLAIVKEGSGNETFSATNNSYTGGTTIAAGTLTITNSNGIGASTANLSVSGGTFSMTGAISQTQHNIFVGGTSSGAGSASCITIGSGNLTASLELDVYNNGSTVTLSGGTLAFTDLFLNGNYSALVWNSGTLSFLGGPDFEANDNLGGTITISNGRTLSVLTDVFSNSSNMAINQTGGNNSSAANMFFGAVFGFTTTYTMSGGNLTAPGVASSGNASNWGESGALVFTQTGGSVQLGDVNLATALAGSANVTINGANASFTAGNLDLGGNTITSSGGTACLTMQNGTLSIATLRIWANGCMVVNGGTTTIGSVASFTSGDFSWTGGSLFLVSAQSIGAGTFLGPQLTIATGQTLSTSGGLTNGGTINFTGGVLAGTGQIVNNNLLSGYGTIGGSGEFVNNNEISVTGGCLTISNSNGSNTNAGNIDLSLGNQLVLTGGNLSNSGTINLNGSAVTGTATLVNNGGTIVGRGSIQSPFSNSSGTVLVPAGTLSISTGFTNGGLINLSDSTANLLCGGIITNTGTIQGFGHVNALLVNDGTIEAIGGTLALSSPGNLVSGLIRAGTGGKVLATGGFSTNNGNISLTGGTFDNNNLAMANAGFITGYGTLSTGGLTNNGNITLGGGTTTVNGNVTNSSGHLISLELNPTVFSGTVTNASGATIIATSTTAIFGGPFNNSGTYASDPSADIFQSDVSNTGTMTGAAGDSYNFSGGNLTNSGNFTNGGTLSSGDNITNTGTFVQSGSQTWLVGSTFTNTGGTATFASNSGSAASANLSVLVSGGSVTFAASQNLAGLTISGGVAAITSGTVKTNSLSISGAGTLDIQHNDLIVEGASATKIASELGTGITSSTLASGQEIVVVDNSLAGLTALGGQSVDSSSILVVPTYLGDANLDGVVDIKDLQILANHWQASVSNWTLGDFNGDGIVDIRDLQALANHWQDGVGSGGGGSGESFSTALQASFATATPEPGTLAVLGIGAVGILRRRRR